MGKFDEGTLRAGTTCEVCGGIKPCEGCKSNYKEPGTSVKEGKGEMDVTLPAEGTELPGDITKNGVASDTKEKVAQMLRERGYNPSEWVIKQMIINEWQGMRPKDRGTIPLKQTKAQLVRNIPIEETPWHGLVTAIDRATDAAQREPRTPLKPTKGHPRTTVLLGDDQAPWINEAAHEAVCEFLRDFQPDRLVYMGDGLDFESVKTYAIQHPQWEATISETLSSFYRIMSERMDAAGNPEAYFLEGNHEHRLQKYLLNQAKPLYGIHLPWADEDDPHVLSVEHLGGFKKMGITYVKNALGAYPYQGLEIAKDFWAYHGWVAKKKAGMSALATVETMNASAIVGHTHRLAVTNVTRWVGDDPVTYYAVETGTLAVPHGIGYAKNPDWQTGFITVTDWPDGHVAVDVARFTGDTLTWRDQRWTITATGVRRGA